VYSCKFVKKIKCMWSYFCIDKNGNFTKKETKEEEEEEEEEKKERKQKRRKEKKERKELVSGLCGGLETLNDLGELKGLGLEEADASWVWVVADGHLRCLDDSFDLLQDLLAKPLGLVPEFELKMCVLRYSIHNLHETVGGSHNGGRALEILPGVHALDGPQQQPEGGNN